MPVHVTVTGPVERFIPDLPGAGQAPGTMNQAGSNG
jgi:hypothetical protein